MNFISLNGRLMPASEPSLLAANRSYRYGDGLFETIKVQRGAILLSNYHFERLFAGLSLLKFQFNHLAIAQLEKFILELCEKNNCLDLARVRLSIFRGDGNLKDAPGPAEFLIECWPLDPSIKEFNEQGLVIDIYPLARKTTDLFS